MNEFFRKTIRKEFAFLKRITDVETLYSCGIRMPVTKGVLLPVCDLHRDDHQLIELLAKWREENSFAYPTRFPVTVEGTAKWLHEKLLDVEDRILFLIYDRHGHLAGHLGYANCFNEEGLMEIDNVVRGRKDAQKGLMGDAMNTVMEWARTTLWPSGFFLRVLESNRHAIEFYERLEWRPAGRTPLCETREGDSVSLSEIDRDSDEKPADFFVRMETVGATPPQPIGEEMILTAGPSISCRESSYAYDAAKYGWNQNWKKYLQAFEKEFADYVDVPHAIATSSCTGALHIALAALGVGPGDEVIVPDITWVATANAVLYVGATPVFADVDPDTWLLDPKSFESMIGPNTKAVMPVHLYGHPCSMSRIMEIAEKHDLFVVEDAAPSIGAEVDGQRTGSFGHFGAFSFQGAKLAVTGEGGMLVTKDRELYERAYSVWDQGRQLGTFWIERNGLKYKMSNVQAAIGLGQIQRNDEMVEAKRRIFSWYEEGLAGVDQVKLNREAIGTHSIYWMSSLLLKEGASVTRKELIERLKAANVDTRPVFPAISQYPIWPRTHEAQPVAKLVGDGAINLPSGVCLRREEVAYVCRQFKNILG